MIQPGDIVRLKSGGPNMTVERWIAGNPEAFDCAWFVGSALIRQRFAAALIEKAPQETP